MTGLKTKRLIWTIIFLGITLLAIVLEVVAAVWHPAGSIPWTEYIAQYAPWPVQLAAYVVLMVWLPFHFWRADAQRKAAYRQGFADGKVHGQELSRMAASVRASRPVPGEPMCSHGFVFGRSDHHCGELPSNATRFTPVRYAPGRSDGR